MQTKQKPTSLKAWVPNKQQNNETPQALHDMHYRFLGPGHSKAKLVQSLSPLPDAKLANASPTSKHGHRQ